MLVTNARAGVQHEYFNFYYDTKKDQHVCWYMPLGIDTLQEELKQAEEVMNGTE